MSRRVGLSFSRLAIRRRAALCAVMGAWLAAPALAEDEQGSSTAPPTADWRTCPEDQFNLFGVTDPAELDNLMRAQDYATRFLAGAQDQDGGSAAGTVFGDIGVFLGALGEFVRQAGVLSSVWGAFSEVVLTTAEAYSGLLPGEMELTVEASPASFEEDSEAVGSWEAHAVARSGGLKLTEKLIEAIMEKALEQGLGELGVPADEPIDTGELPPDEYWDRLLDTLDPNTDLDGRVREQAKRAMKRFLSALHAEWSPSGFDIPRGCWELSQMTDAEGPALLTAHLSGDAVAWVDPEGRPPRSYRAAKVGESRIEIRTVTDYRKAIELPGGISFATTYAFGGDQSVAGTTVEVLPIQVFLAPSIVQIEPGDPVNFVATVENAVDTRVRWTASAGEFDEIVDFGEGTHEAVLFTRGVRREEYPIRVEVESVSRSGIRASGVPVRRAVGYVQIPDPILLLSPPDVCLGLGEEQGFRADVVGAGEDIRIRWSKTGGTFLERDGVTATYRPPGTEGVYSVGAEVVGHPEIAAEARVQVGTCECFFRARLSGDPRRGFVEGDAAVWSQPMQDSGRVAGPLVGMLSALGMEEALGASSEELEQALGEMAQEGAFVLKLTEDVGSIEFFDMTVQSEDAATSGSKLGGTLKVDGLGFLVNATLAIHSQDDGWLTGTLSGSGKGADHRGMGPVTGPFEVDFQVEFRAGNPTHGAFCGATFD